ncbi:MAG: peptidase family [Herminiimonas sp.]|nr:peptidase family [Herminiimonas sp.]
MFMKSEGRRLFAALGLTVLLGCGVNQAWAAKVTERSLQKQAAESERAALREKLAALKRDMNRTETAKDHAADALAHSEAAISNANRELRELAEEQTQTSARLAALVKERGELTRVVDAGNRQLGKLLRDQYVAGNEDRIKLLLSGDNPNRINRDLQYFGYVSQAQARLIESLRANLQAVEKNQADTQNAKDELDEIAQEQRDQRAVLEKEKANRAVLLSQLSDKLATQRKQVGNIQRDEERLAGLVGKLTRLIEEQRKAELAEAERRRRQAERALAERQKQQKLQQQLAQQQAQQAARQKPSGPPPKASAKPPANPSANPDAIDADENPAKLASRNELRPEPAVQPGFFPDSFSALRGQLRLPVRGDLIARFGSKRGDGPSWKGLFIRAAEGAEVRAVAGGRVVFAEWLRGFGNLVIVDHGSQYMTIYGNNQSILKRAGDPVRTGDIIASAGNSGGNEQSGLYFEMRHQGRAFDPLGWVTIR